MLIVLCILIVTISCYQDIVTNSIMITIGYHDNRLIMAITQL